MCPAHFDDPYLRKVVEDAVADEDAQCGYCDAGEGGALVDEVVEVVRDAIDRHYDTANDAGMPRDEGEWAFPTLDTADVLGELGGIDDWSVCDRILRDLEWDDWVPSGDPRMSYYEKLSRGWRGFEAYVRHTSRFLLAPSDPPSAYDPDPDLRPEQVLPAIARSINDTFELIDDLPESTIIYRARTFDDSLPFKHFHEMVAPPRSKAAQGRMNAAGIAVLYAGLDAETAASEVYDGKDLVAICRLRPLRPLTVVDLTSVPVLSPYDPRASLHEFHRTAFLNEFVREITRPITRDSRVHHEYTPTQIVTEYLRWQMLPAEVGLDGIVYPSARTGGKNIVVFAGAQGCLADGDLPPEESPTERRPRWEDQLLQLVDATVEVRRYQAPATTVFGTPRPLTS